MSREGDGSAPGEEDLDRIFGAPFRDFVAVRNSLVKLHRTEGRREIAAALRSVSKPPLPVWAVNQLHFRGELDELLEAGEAVRRAQEGSLAGGGLEELRQAMERQRSTVQSLTGRASAVIEAADLPVSSATLQRVTRMLEALAARGRRPAEPRPGRLVSDLEVDGFSELSTLNPGSPPPVRPRPKRPEAPKMSPPASEKADRARAEAQELARKRQKLRVEIEQARVRLDRARGSLDRARAELAETQSRVDALMGEVEQREEALRGLEEKQKALP